MKKVVLIFIALLLNISCIQAGEIDKYIKKSDFEFKSVVSILAKNTKDNSTIYKRNSSKLLNPASILKTLTFGASYLTLGSDYKFSTEIYKDNKNNLYIKLGADPLLTQSNLVTLFQYLSQSFDTKKISYIYIDDSIIDKTPYPQGWMNDDMWPNQRLLTPYIVDNNTTEVLIKRSSLSTRTDIIQNDDYKFAIINELKLEDKNPEAKQNIEIVRKYGDLPIINFRGTIVQDEIMRLPVLDPELNFKIKTQAAIKKAGINYNKKLFNKEVPKDAKLVTLISHDIAEVSRPILYSSDNFAAEIVFKVAGAKYINYSHPGTTQDGINMFNSIFPAQDIKITDASGVSRYNLIDCDFVVDSLIKLNKDETFKNLMATSGQGTLGGRLLFLKDNLRAKTGTLSRMSAISGYLTTKKNKDIAFAIIVQNSPKRAAILKNFEDNIITLLYRKY